MAIAYVLRVPRSAENAGGREEVPNPIWLASLGGAGQSHVAVQPLLPSPRWDEGSSRLTISSATRLRRNGSYGNSSLMTLRARPRSSETSPGDERNMRM